jgi:hypothetical protein
MKQNVFDNITSVLKDFGKSRKKYVSVSRRVIQIAVVSSSNIKDHLTRHMEKMMGTSKKTLYKHTKFQLQIDENDELVDTERRVNQYQVQFKTFFNLYLNHSTISNEQ